MGIELILNDVKNFINERELSLRNFLGKGVVAIKGNSIPAIASIICLAAIAIGVKCYNAFSFSRKEAELVPLSNKQISQVTNDKLKELQDKFEQELKENNEKLESQLKAIKEKQELDLKATDAELIGKVALENSEIALVIVEEFEEITIEFKPITKSKEVEIENEFPPTDLPPLLPLNIRLKEAYENYIGEKVEGIDESWDTIENEFPPADLPPMLPLTIRIKEAYENYLGEKVEGIDESWNTIG